MNGEYNTMAVMQLWREYHATHQASTLLDFGKWLVERESGEAELNRKYEAIKESEQSHDLDGLSIPKFPDAMIGFLIRRLYRFSTIYFRKVMEGSEIESIEEFAYLTSIMEGQRPAKSQLVLLHINELPSGMEIIRKLKRKGLIDEFEDPNDKRIRRVGISPKGMSVLLDCLSKMKFLGKAMFGDTSDEKKAEIIKLLAPLNTIHTKAIKSVKHADAITLPIVIKHFQNASLEH